MIGFYSYIYLSLMGHGCIFYYCYGMWQWIETSNFYLTLCNLTLQLCVCAVLFSILWRYHSKRYVNISCRNTKTSVACSICCSGYILQNQSAAILYVVSRNNKLIMCWSNALCLNIKSWMNYLIKPSCTYRMTAFILCPLISTKKSNFNYFNFWYFNQSQNIQMLQWRRITSLFPSNR